MDLTKLTPAPFFLDSRDELCFGTPGDDSDSLSVFEHDNPEDMKLFALARNAFDVMMRRGWSASVDLQSDDPRKWYAVDEYGSGIDCSRVPGTKEFPLYIDPFTALVEYDKWYRENVEKA